MTQAKQIANNIQLKSLQDSYQTGLNGFIFMGAILLFIAGIKLIYEFLTSEIDYFSFGILIFVCLVYLACYFIGRSIKNRMIIPLFALTFYIVHSGLEYLLKIYSVEIISQISFSGTGIYNRMTILFDLIPLLYFSLRIALAIIFVRLIYLANTIKKFEK